MKANIQNIFLSISILSITACASTGMTFNNSAEKLAVKRTLEDYQTAINNSNLDKLANLYTEHAVQVAPNEPTVSGQQAILLRANKNHSHYSYQLNSQIDEIRIENGLATLRTTFSETMTNRSDADDINTTNGVWLLLLEQQRNGSWKIFTETWNDDKLATN